MVGQNEVILKINQKAGDSALEKSTGYTVDAGYDLNFIRLQYFISEISFIHDGGQETKADGVYILANALEDTEYSIGDFDIDDLEAIKFYIGVDQKANHADPTSWPFGHALAPTNPTMHWGWAAGYRFAAIEGRAGNRMAFTYQIHALGDQHYGAVELDVEEVKENGTISVELNADYLRLFDGLDVSFGLIEHSDAPKAALLLQNLKENVFTAASTTGTFDHDAFDGRFDVIGNPSTNGQIVIVTELNGHTDVKAVVVDMSGKEIDFIPALQNGKYTFEVPGSGMYQVMLQSGDKILAVRPAIVN